MSEEIKQEEAPAVEEKVEEPKAQSSQAQESILEKATKLTATAISIFDPITEKVRKVVLDFGEIILTISVVIGLISAVVDGLALMGNVGFFSGLSSMFNNIVSVVMAALVIFLLFAIRKNTEK